MATLNVAIYLHTLDNSPEEAATALEALASRIRQTTEGETKLHPDEWGALYSGEDENVGRWWITKE